MTPHDATQMTRSEVEMLQGPIVLEFGAKWCGYCRAFAPTMEYLLRQFPNVRHFVVEDGPGEPLGRSFRVKLWPTLVFLRDGELLAQFARPNRAEALEGLQEVAAETATGV